MKMKKINFLFVLVIGAMLFASCGRVDPGYMGVKVKTLGQNKGIAPEPVDVGRYWLGIPYDLYTYPTFVNIYPFTKSETEGSEIDESFYFQSVEGITCNVDLAISCRVDPTKVVTVFTTYRKEMVPIIKDFLRQDVNNFFVDFASTLKVDELYSTKKMEMIQFAESELKNKVEPYGIIIEDLSYKSDIRFPQQVQDAIIAKIEAIQLATQKQNEIVQAEADAKKAVAAAQGEAESILVKAKAQADANLILARSLTPTLVNYELAIRWNGVTPIYSGNGAVLPPLFNK